MSFLMPALYTVFQQHVRKNIGQQIGQKILKFNLSPEALEHFSLHVIAVLKIAHKF